MLFRSSCFSRPMRQMCIRDRIDLERRRTRTLLHSGGQVGGRIRLARRGADKFVGSRIPRAGRRACSGQPCDWFGRTSHRRSLLCRPPRQESYRFQHKTKSTQAVGEGLIEDRSELCTCWGPRTSLGTKLKNRTRVEPADGPTSPTRILGPGLPKALPGAFFAAPPPDESKCGGGLFFAQ